MICTLNTAQQKLLFGKVAIDLKNTPSFDFRSYAKGFYDLVLNKTSDPTLAANYVAMLPMNIRAVMGVNKTVFSKLAKDAELISKLEAVFENFNEVEDFVNTFITQQDDLAILESTIQKNSLTKSVEQEPAETPSIEFEPIALSDIPSDEQWYDGKPTGLIKPEMKFYADAKAQLIAGVKEDGSSRLGNADVRMAIMTTADFKISDFYPDTQAAILAGDEKVQKAAKEGVVLIVTDTAGNPLRFDDKYEHSPIGQGRYIYFTLRKYTGTLNAADHAAIKQLSTQMSVADATALVTKRNEQISKIREYVGPMKKLMVNITGGTINYGKHAAKNKITIGNLNFSDKPFTPYKGIPERGQKPNVFYFDYNGITMTVDSPAIPNELVDKFTQLLTDDVKVKQGSKTFAYGTPEKIKLFKQFVYTEPDVFDLSTGANGELVVKKLGVTQQYGYVDEMAQDIRDMLTRKVPVKKISAQEAKGKTKAVNLKTAMYNQVWEKVLSTGDVEYYMIGQVQLKVNNTAFKNNLYNDFTITNGNIKVEQRPYYKFISDNFLLSTNYDIDGQGNLQTTGSYINFQVDSGAAVKVAKEEKKAVVVEKTQASVKSDVTPLFDDEGNFVDREPAKPVATVSKLSAKDKLRKLKEQDPKKFNKIVGQNGLDATLEQIDAAKRWYESHPMSVYFPFDEMFDVVNQQDSNSIATWTTSGVTLYRGANYSDLYHEAWHGFSQAFIRPEDRARLYNEVRRKSGEFQDYRGNTVTFATANDLQLEEFLAEDFRGFMLTGKVAQESPVRNSLFKRILNFLKSLFGTTDSNRVVVDQQVNQTIRDIYEKLRVGDLGSYTFSVENRNFDTLNKALTALHKNEKQESLSFENSNLIFNSVNSLFSEGIDLLNQTEGEGDERTAPTYTTVMLSTTKGLRELYEYAKATMEERLAEYVETNETSPSKDLEKKIELLRYALRNFGDIENLYKNRRDEGVIGYHMYKSELIAPEVFDELDTIIREDEARQEIDEMVERETEGRQTFDRGGNESSIFDLASREIRNIIKSLNKTDLEGNVVYNQLGFPDLVGFRETFAYIARSVQNSKDISEMYGTLQREANIFGPIKQLLSKMGPLSYQGQSTKDIDLWSKFFQTFNKYRIPLVQTTVNATITDDENVAPTYDIRVGNALADYKRIDQDWRSEFLKAVDNKFIRSDIKGNYLDVAAVFAKYPSIQAANADPMDFLRDIGVKMKYIAIIKSELEKAVNAGTIRLSGIYSNLLKHKELGLPVRGLGAFLTHNRKLGIVGQTGQNSNYGKILALQSKYSGEYSDFMTQNAAGDPQSEFSQNNSLTQIVKQINASGSYNELVNNPPTAHYNNDLTPGRPYNPFIDSSIWIRSLYNMDEAGGPRYGGNEIVVDNLSGVNSSVNDKFFTEGVISSQADAITKLLSDFHVQLMKYTPELTRHAGKKTSLTVYLRDYKTGAKNTRLYIDTENFVARNNEFNQGFDDFHKILLKYLAAELRRVNYAKYLLTPEAGVENYDFDYLKRGTELVAFSGVFSADTKKALYKVDNLEEFLNTEEGISLADKLYDESFEYFNNLVFGVQNKLTETLFLSPSLLEKTRTDADAIGKKDLTDADVYNALARSFVANTWVHHFEEMIMLYGDIAQFKDFFKRNASLNSTGDIIRNDQPFVNHVNNELGRPFTKKLGVEVQPYDGILNAAISQDVLLDSVYINEYNAAVNSPTINQKYGMLGINEADAGGLIAIDTYRIVLKALSKWTIPQEKAFQDILAGKPLHEIDAKNIFPVLKMGYYGPLQTEHLPLTALHKFALMPLIPGLAPNLDRLHERMMREGVDYHTFNSGSKVSTVSGKDGPNAFYKDVSKRELNDQPFVKNPVFVEYLKYQVEAKPKFKGKMTLPTQLRKLIEIGLMERGMPTDYKGDLEHWKAMSESEKRQTSHNYDLRQRYIRSIRELQDYKRKELLSDIGWRRDSKGNLIGSMESLLTLVSNELKRSDVGEHEWAYIQTVRGKEIKNDLDISQSADIIEKVVVALVNKRLINIKVNGEQLVMVPTTGFEDLAFIANKFEVPNDELLARYGSNDLPTYHLREGKIAAAKVKIALQGGFKKLLQLDDVKQRSKDLGISKFEALNLLIKDEDWLSEGDNRAMISMVGARIPTQGPNSADFVEVYEFLPEIAGNIIVAPSEVTSKTGGDFDYDKLPMMMPNIRFNAEGKPELAHKYNEDQARQAYNMILKQNIHKQTFAGLDKNEIRALLRTSDRFEKIDAAVAKLLGPDYYEELAKLVQEETMDTFEVFYEKLNGSAAIENNLQKAVRGILERPENFGALIRPNDTDLVKPLADEMKTMQDTNRKGFEKEGTRMFEPLHNLKVQQSNSIGKDTLGIGAISNTFNAVFNSVGLVLNTDYAKGMSIVRAKMLLDHNSTDEKISLSNLSAARNEADVADIISQLINGWVDVEKDDWISYIQGNKEIAPTILFMVQAGVPIKDVVYFVSQPLVRKYVDEQRLIKSNFASVLGRGGKSVKTPKRTAKINILKDRNNGFAIADFKAKTIYKETLRLTDGLHFEANDLLDRLRGASKSDYTLDDYDRAAFMHFLEIEDMAREIEKVSRGFNFDTTPLQSLTEFHAKIDELRKVNESRLVPNEIIKELFNNSPIGPFYIHEFALEVFGRLFPLRNHELLNQFLSTVDDDMLNDVYSVGDQDSRIRFYHTFKNDLLTYIFQQEFRGFDATAPYANNTVEFPVQDAKLKFGAIAKDGKLFVDRAQLHFDYMNNMFAKVDYGQGELAPVAENAFINFDEYQHFVYERETLRKLYPTKAISNTIEFEYYLNNNKLNDYQAVEGETDEAREVRIQKTSYEQWLRDTALFNIMSPYQLFRSGRTVAYIFEGMLERYDSLKQNFSLLKNIKISGKDGLVNLQPAVLKWEKDEIDVFHENFKDLANSNKLLGLKGIDQRDADHIAKFFKKLPLYLYMQSGPNTRSPFSFARMLPQDDILRIMQKPVRELTANMNEEFLLKFLNRFLVANADFSTRSRFKEFLAPDKEATENKLRPIFTESRLLQQLSFRGKPIKIESITNMRGQPGAAKNFPDHIAIDLDLLKLKYQEKAWTAPALENVEPIDADEFATFDEFLTFVLLHKSYHDSIKQEKDEDKGSYENRINIAALDDLKTNYQRMQYDMFNEEVVTQPGIQTVSSEYGVIKLDTNPSSAKTEEFIDILRPQIQSQTFKENKGMYANEMFHYGIMWARMKPQSNPIKINSAEKAGYYAYHELDQKGESLPSMDVLQPIMDDIQKAIGVDMSDYDSMIGNIYLPGQYVYPHRDTTESKSARNYPVIVYTIGNDAGLGIWDDNKGKMTFANTYDSRYAPGTLANNNPTSEVVTKNGTIYTFGMEGKGRFELVHTTPSTSKKSKAYPPITLPNGQVITNYTITLTFRRAADLTQAMPTAPVIKKVNSNTQATSFADMSLHSGGAVGSDTVWGDIGKEFGILPENIKHYYAEGEKTPTGNTPVSKEALKEADQHLKKANKTLGRKFPTSNEFVNNLLRRNYFQVKNSSAVYAIGKIENNLVNGGTGWAVQMAVDMGKSVFVYDQERHDWFTMIDGKFQETGMPTLSKNFAGVGTREINDAGRREIREVYKFTKENLGETVEQVIRQEPVLLSDQEVTNEINKCR